MFSNQNLWLLEMDYIPIVTTKVKVGRSQHDWIKVYEEIRSTLSSTQETLYKIKVVYCSI